MKVFEVSTLPSLLVALALLEHVQGTSQDGGAEIQLEVVTGECIPDQGGSVEREECAEVWDSTKCGDKDGCKWFVHNECQARQPLSNSTMKERTCAFPFTYNGKEYNACTWDGWDNDNTKDAVRKKYEPWCALKPEDNSDIVWDKGSVFDYGALSEAQREWGYCGETCPQDAPGYECGVRAVVLGGDIKVAETDPMVNTQVCSNFGDWNPALSPCRTCACTKTLEADQDDVWTEKMTDQDGSTIESRRIVEHGGSKGDVVCTQPRWDKFDASELDMGKEEGFAEFGYGYEADDVKDHATWEGNPEWYATMSIEEPASCDATSICKKNGDDVTPVPLAGWDQDACDAKGGDFTSANDGGSSGCAERIKGFAKGEQKSECENDSGCAYTPGSGGCGTHSTVDSCEADHSNLCFWSPVCLKTKTFRTAGSCYAKNDDRKGNYVDSEICSVHRNDKVACENAKKQSGALECKWVDPGKPIRRRRLEDSDGRGATYQLCDSKKDAGQPCYDRWCTTKEIKEYGTNGRHCKIPYQIADNFNSDGPRHDDIRASLAHIVEATMQDGKQCLEFNDMKSNLPKKHIKFSNESWPPCASEIGKSMKKPDYKGQIVYLDGSSTKHCFKKFGQAPYPGNVVHEILHALGLLHEHSRKDRDDHIQVQCLPKLRIRSSEDDDFVYKNNMFYTHDYACNNNINFAMNKAEIQLTPYDCDSIMHYGCELNYKDTYAMWNVCAGDKCQTCSVEGSWPGLGQRETMSPFDIWSIQEMYCPHFHQRSGNVKATADGNQPDTTWQWPTMAFGNRAFLAQRPATGGDFTSWSTMEKCNASTFDASSSKYSRCNEQNGKCTRGACSPDNCGKYCEITAPRANSCTLVIEQTSIWPTLEEGIYAAEVKSQQCACPADYMMYESLNYKFNERYCKHSMCKPSMKCFQCIQTTPLPTTCPGGGAQCNTPQGFKCDGDKWGKNCPTGEVGSIDYVCENGMTKAYHGCKKATSQPPPLNGKATSQPQPLEAASSACPADKGLRVDSVFKRCDQLYGWNASPKIASSSEELCNHSKYGKILRDACKTTCCKLQGSMHGQDTTVYFEPTEDELHATKMESKASTGDAAGLNPEDHEISIYDEAGRCTEDGGRCKFPFIYRGAEWNACLPWQGTYWCSKTDNYDKDRQWGNCARCITKEKWQNVLANMKSENQSLISDMGAEQLARVFDSALDNFALAYEIAQDIQQTG